MGGEEAQPPFFNIFSFGNPSVRIFLSFACCSIFRSRAPDCPLLELRSELRKRTSPVKQTLQRLYWCLCWRNRNSIFTIWLAVMIDADGTGSTGSTSPLAFPFKFETASVLQ